MVAAIEARTLTAEAPAAKRISSARLWASRTMSGLVIAFLAFDGLMKFVKPAPVVEAFAKLGFPLDLAVPLGVILLACTLMYTIPRTAIIGAVLLTGYFGGAIVTHLRVGDPLFSHVLFPIYLSVLMWGGLYIRDERVGELLRSRT